MYAHIIYTTLRYELIIVVINKLIYTNPWRNCSSNKKCSFFKCLFFNKRIAKKGELNKYVHSYIYMHINTYFRAQAYAYVCCVISYKK